MIKTEGLGSGELVYSPATTLGEVAQNIRKLRNGQQIHEYDIHYLKQYGLVDVINRKEIADYEAWKELSLDLEEQVKEDYKSFTKSIEPILLDIGIAHLDIKNRLKFFNAKDKSWQANAEGLFEHLLAISAPDDVQYPVNLLIYVANTVPNFKMDSCVEEAYTYMDMWTNYLEYVPRLIDGNEEFRGLYHMFTETSNTMAIFRPLGNYTKRAQYYQELTSTILDYQKSLTELKQEIMSHNYLRPEINKYWDLQARINMFESGTEEFLDMHDQKVKLTNKSNKYAGDAVDFFADWSFDQFENHRMTCRIVQKRKKLRESPLFTQD